MVDAWKPVGNRRVGASTIHFLCFLTRDMWFDQPILANTIFSCLFPAGGYAVSTGSWTVSGAWGVRWWFVSVVSSGGGQTIREASVEKQTLSEKKAMSSPTVRAVFDNFPASKFCKIDKKRYENKSSGIGSDIKTEALVWEPIEKE